MKLGDVIKTFKMNYFNFKVIVMKNVAVLLVIVFLGLFTGCGGGSDGESTPSVKTGYLIDAPIAGVTYECDSKVDVTDQTGKFECTNPPVVFKIGALVIGTLESFTSDSKVYPQDLLGLSRDNFTDEELIALTRFLQSLDDDGEYSDVINIDQNRSNLFVNSGDFDKDQLGEYAATAGVELVDKETAMEHLKDNVEIIDTDTGSIDFSKTNSGVSEYVTFNEAFIALEDDEYYSIVCEDITDENGAQAAKFDLSKVSVRETGLPLSIENETLVLDGGAIKLQYVVSGAADYFGGESTLIIVNEYYNNERKGFRPEVWYYVGDNSPLTTSCPDGDAKCRDIDVIANLWYTDVGGNEWTAAKHTVPGSCLDDGLAFFKAFEIMQSEINRRAESGGTPYNLNQ